MVSVLIREINQTESLLTKSSTDNINVEVGTVLLRALCVCS